MRITRDSICVKSPAVYLDQQKVVSLTLDGSGDPCGILFKTQRGRPHCVSLSCFSRYPEERWPPPPAWSAHSAHEFQRLLMGVGREEVLPPKESDKTGLGVTWQGFLLCSQA